MYPTTSTTKDFHYFPFRDNHSGSSHIKYPVKGTQSWSHSLVSLVSKTVQCTQCYDAGGEIHYRKEPQDNYVRRLHVCRFFKLKIFDRCDIGESCRARQDP